MSTLYRTPPRLVVGQIFGADNLSWRFYGNVLRGNSLHESFNHSGLSPWCVSVAFKDLWDWAGNWWQFTWISVYARLSLFSCLNSYFFYFSNIKTPRITLLNTTLNMWVLCCGQYMPLSRVCHWLITPTNTGQSVYEYSFGMCKCNLSLLHIAYTSKQSEMRKMEQWPFDIHTSAQKYLLSMLLRGTNKQLQPYSSLYTEWTILSFCEK